MIMSIDGLGPFNVAILVQISHRSVLGDNVMVRFEGQLDPLLALMKVEYKIEYGKRM